MDPNVALSQSLGHRTSNLGKRNVLYILCAGANPFPPPMHYNFNESRPLLPGVCRLVCVPERVVFNFAAINVAFSLQRTNGLLLSLHTEICAEKCSCMGLLLLKCRSHCAAQWERVSTPHQCKTVVCLLNVIESKRTM